MWRVKRLIMKEKQSEAELKDHQFDLDFFLRGSSFEHTKLGLEDEFDVGLLIQLQADIEFQLNRTDEVDIKSDDPFLKAFVTMFEKIVLKRLPKMKIGNMKITKTGYHSKAVVVRNL